MILANERVISISEAAAKELVTGFLRAPDYLRAVYQYLKEHRHEYSYVKFSEEMGFGRNNYLHQIVVGHRKISLKAAERLTQIMQIKGKDKQYFLALVAHENAANSQERESAFNKLVELKKCTMAPTLDKDMLQYLSEWYHPVIREMAGLPNFNASAEWICERIMPPISKLQAEESLVLLKKIGFLIEDKNTGTVVQSEINIRTGASVRAMAVRSYHQKMMGLASEALLNVPASERDFQAITINVSEQLLHELKSDIDSFWRQIMEKSTNCTNPQRVCQLNIQMFPVTKKMENTK